MSTCCLQHELIIYVTSMSKPNSVLGLTSLINFSLCKEFSSRPQYMYFEIKNLALTTLNVIIGPSLPFRNLISITSAFFCSLFILLNYSDLQMIIFVSMFFSWAKACFLISSIKHLFNPTRPDPGQKNFYIHTFLWYLKGFKASWNLLRTTKKYEKKLS